MQSYLMLNKWNTLWFTCIRPLLCPICTNCKPSAVNSHVGARPDVDTRRSDCRLKQLHVHYLQK